jgi:hypothetical protein
MKNYDMPMVVGLKNKTNSLDKKNMSDYESQMAEEWKKDFDGWREAKQKAKEAISANETETMTL